MTFLDNFDESIRDALMKAAETVRRHRRVQLVSHYDADGITSMAIVRAALTRAGIETDILNFPTLTESQMRVVEGMDFECMVMTDLGTSFLLRIRALKGDCIVLDHHALPREMPSTEGMVFVNPWTAGVNGSENSCAATVALLFAMALDEDNFDLCQLAIAGMIGDYQHRSGFAQYNRIVVDEAVRRGLIVPMESVTAIGDVADFLTMSIDPYLKGLTGNREAVERALGDMPHTLELGDCNLARRLEALVVDNLRSNNVSQGEIDGLLRTRWWLRDFGVDAGCLCDVLDACGRLDRADLALQVVDTRDLSLGKPLFDGFRGAIIEQFQEVERNGVVQMENLQYFVHHTPSSGGLIATAVLKFFGCDTKPVVALMDMGDFINLSSRSNQKILDQGIALNQVLTAVAPAHGAQCGGHPKASGGTLLPGTMEAFLKDLDAEMGRAKAARGN